MKRGWFARNVLAVVGALALTEAASGYYCPRLGRWLSRDPIGERGGRNVYTYVQNDPAGQADALGRCSLLPGPRHCPPRSGKGWQPRRSRDVNDPRELDEYVRKHNDYILCERLHGDRCAANEHWEFEDSAATMRSSGFCCKCVRNTEHYHCEWKYWLEPPPDGWHYEVTTGGYCVAVRDPAPPLPPAPTTSPPPSNLQKAKKWKGSQEPFSGEDETIALEVINFCCYGNNRGDVTGFDKCLADGMMCVQSAKNRDELYECVVDPCGL